MTHLHDMFQLPLSQQAYDQFLQLNDEIANLDVTSEYDKWVYIWDTEVYSSRQAYKYLMGTTHIHPAFKWLWKSKCQPKQGIFLVAYAR